MNEFKYIVTETEEGNQQMFIFPKSVPHDEMADVVCYIKEWRNNRDWDRPYRKPISAGFTDGVRCYGRSETLNIDSRKDDDAALLKDGGSRKGGGACLS